MARQRSGNRRHTATFEKHNGKTDVNGNPTLHDNADWLPVVEGWPCEVLATAGGEAVRGRQVTAQTTHILYGEYFGAKGVDATHRIQIPDYPTLSVVAAYDPDGDAREMRVEAKVEG